MKKIILSLALLSSVGFADSSPKAIEELAKIHNEVDKTHKKQDESIFIQKEINKASALIRAETIFEINRFNKLQNKYVVMSKEKFIKLPQIKKK